MVVPGTLFEEFGFNYIGPIDGHDLDALVPTLQNMQASCKGPQFLHVVTQQGQGLQARRGRPDRCTTAPASSIRPSGIVSKADERKPTYTQVFGDWLCDMAAARPAPGRHHAGDARRLGPGASSRSASRSATSTSASPSSTR